MKKVTKILIFVILSLFFVSFLSSYGTATTFNDTTFNVEENQSLMWKITGGSPDYIGFRYNLTIDNLYTGVHNSVESFMIDCTLRLYNKTADLWSTMINKTFFTAANETQNYLYFTDALESQPLYFIIPTPINLTMLGEFAFTVLDLAIIDYEIDGNTIILIHTIDVVDYRLTYNSEGILTKLVANFAGVPILVLTLETDGGEISFGGYFLIFAIIGVVGLIYGYKQKMN